MQRDIEHLRISLARPTSMTSETASTAATASNPNCPFCRRSPSSQVRAAEEAMPSPSPSLLLLLLQLAAEAGRQSMAIGRRMRSWKEIVVSFIFGREAMRPKPSLFPPGTLLREWKTMEKI